MRILLINAKSTLANALAECSGVDVVSVWPRKHHFAHLPPAKIPQRLYAGGGKLNLWAAWQLRKLIQDIRPNIVHAFYGRALAHTLLAASTLRERPQIVSFRGITSPLSRINAGDWLSYRHRSVDAHACESAAVRQALTLSGIDAARCHVIYNSMFMPPASRPGRAALIQFGIPADAFVVGTMATMRRVKRIDVLLRAAIECADLRDVYWILFGLAVDPEIRRLAANRKIRDRVRLLGHRHDASELISGADVFVMPSRAEALCQALLEAMYQRVCPVVSDAGGMKEVVRDEENGLVVPVEDVAALVTAIRRLHADRQLVARFAAAAQQRVAMTFTPERMAERTLAIYHQLLGFERPASYAA